MHEELFWEVHSGLEREGPGDAPSLRRALGMMTALPRKPDILDVGCGPGAQSLALAQLTQGNIISLDKHRPFLDLLSQTATARGLDDRIRAVNASMSALPFRAHSFDAIWSEGAIYIMGFREGLSSWKRFLKPGGYIAVTEPCWTKPEGEIPEQARDLWKDYPAIASVRKIRAAVEEEGYKEIGHFVLAPLAWWNYYGPMEKRIAMLRLRYRGDPAALEKLDAIQAGVDGYRRFGDCFSYLFIVMQLP